MRPAKAPPMPKMTESKSSEEREKPTKAAVPTLPMMAHHDRGTPPRRKACHGGRWGICQGATALGCVIPI